MKNQPAKRPGPREAGSKVAVPSDGHFVFFQPTTSDAVVSRFNSNGLKDPDLADQPLGTELRDSSECLTLSRISLRNIGTEERMSKLLLRISDWN